MILKKLTTFKMPHKFLTHQKLLSIFCILLFATVLGIGKEKDSKKVQGVSDKNNFAIRTCTLRVPVGQTKTNPPKDIFPTLVPNGKYCDYPQEKKKEITTSSPVIIYHPPTPTPMPQIIYTQITNPPLPQTTTITTVSDPTPTPLPTNTEERIVKRTVITVVKPDNDKDCIPHVAIGATGSIPPSYIYPPLPPGAHYCPEK